MPSLPDGEPAPPSGELPAAAAARWRATHSALGIYIHVPFCAVRCGYCDFNTYTLGELHSDAEAAETAYRTAALAEVDLAARVLGPDRGVSTVFFGGGTPTMLPVGTLTELLNRVRERFGLRAGAEVTVEANPDSVTPQTLAELAEGSVTRVSFGVQSVVPSVLAVLDRTHDPRAVPGVVDAARQAGLGVSLDLIYGTPGETVADWRASLEGALALEPDHVSAYALVVEEGTALAGRVRRGLVPLPDTDDQADKYLLADDLLSAAGLTWYEVSNWARSTEHQSRHNRGYWEGADWWGIGPGAHSHVGGVRWWNVKHPRSYSAALDRGESPAAGREVLNAEEQRDERALLAVRVRGGLPTDELEPAGREALAGLVADGLIDGRALIQDQAVVLTLQGRLLADAVVRRVLGIAPR